MAAERETADRLIATHLAGQIGKAFPARVSGVTKSGLFIRLDETGADGFIPISTLGAEYFHYDEAARALIGERSGQGFRLGDRVEARLVEAVPSAGALRFEMLSAPNRHRGTGGGHKLGKRGTQRARGGGGANAAHALAFRAARACQRSRSACILTSSPADVPVACSNRTARSALSAERSSSTL